MKRTFHTDRAAHQALANSVAAAKRSNLSPSPPSSLINSRIAVKAARRRKLFARLYAIAAASSVVACAIAAYVNL